MKNTAMKTALAVLLFVCSSIASAQNPPRTIIFSADPTGSACSSTDLGLWPPSGKFYTCQSGTWALNSGSGGTCGALGGDVTGTCAANTAQSVKGGTLASLPASCTDRQIYFATDAPAGRNYYVCSWGSFTPVSATSSSGYQPNQLVGGCGVQYTTGLSFTVGTCTYTITGATYTSAITTVTLAAADPTNPRIDVIGVDNTGAVFTITGTPAASPAAPTTDPTTQLPITFATVAANATTPTGVTTTTLYDEGSEWTLTPSANIANSTNNPYHLTHDLEATSAVLGNNFTLVDPAAGTVDLGTTSALTFYIRSKAAWPVGKAGANAARSLSLFWLNGSTQKGNTIVLNDGAFGFQSSQTSSYQQISIPTSFFGLSGVPVTTLEVQVSGPSGSSSIGWYIDWIQLQQVNASPVLPSTLVYTNQSNTYTTGTQNFSQAQHTVPTIVVASTGALPATGCVVGELAMVTGATLGLQLYENSGAGTCTWTQQSKAQSARTACNVVGANNASAALVNGDLGPQTGQYEIPAAATLLEIGVRADAGTPNVILGRDRAGSIVNLLSSALATASAGAYACSNTGGTTSINGSTTCSSTLQNTSLNAGDFLPLVSGTAGGTAKSMTICAIFTIN